MGVLENKFQDNVVVASLDKLLGCEVNLTMVFSVWISMLCN